MPRTATGRERRPRRAGLLAGVLVLALGAAGVGGVVLALERTSPLGGVRARCEAVLDGTTWRFSPVQADNAATIAAIAVRRAMPARAVTIGLATALQESKLVNIDYGDRDSVGLFQQRTSQGWGTIEQIMDPVYSTNAFYDGLDKVAGYGDLPITEAAQAVQRSGFPDAYAQHESTSRAWASALTGHSPAGVTCLLDDVDAPRASDAPGVEAAASALRTRLERDFGPVPTSVDDGAVVVDATALPSGAEHPARLAWAVAHWAVASASTTGVVSVVVGDQQWTRDAQEWGPLDEDRPPAGAGSAHLVLAG